MPLSRICDSLDDCSDASDEIEELCSVMLRNVSVLRNITVTSDIMSYKGLNYGCLKARPNVKRTFDFKYLRYVEICNEKENCFHGEDEWGLDCKRVTMIGGLRCPRDRRIIHPCDHEVLHKCADHFTLTLAHCPLSMDDHVVKQMLHNDKVLPSSCSSKGLAVACDSLSHSIHQLQLIRSLSIVNSNN